MVQIKSVKRAFDVLNLYTLGESELGVTEVGLKLKINKSTAARLLATLEATNILVRNLETRKYRLGSRIMELARVYISRADLSSIARPHLESLNQSTRELVLIHIIKDDKRYCLTWIESSKPITRVIGPDESYGPMTAGAPGKLLLAFLPEEKTRELIEKEGLHRYTAHTITEKAAFLAEIARIRKQGFAISRGEHIQLVETASVPIRDFAGNVIASLSISWLMLPDGQDSEQKYLEMVKKTAVEISAELGYRN